MYDKKGFRKKIMMETLTPFYQIPVITSPPQYAWGVDTDMSATVIGRIEFRLVGKHKEYYIFREC